MEKDFPRDVEVEDEDGSYFLCPLQVESQYDAGRKRSALPMSKSTVYSTAGVPTEIAPAMRSVQKLLE
jgi:hypothetical protein